MNDQLTRFIANIQLASNNYLKELLEEALKIELENKRKELNTLLTSYATNLNDMTRVSILKTQGYINALDNLLIKTTTLTQRKGKTNE